MKINDQAAEFTLDRATEARFGRLDASPEVVRITATASPRAADGRVAPWRVTQRYEIFAEGAVFITMEFALPEGKTTLGGAEISFAADKTIITAAKYRQQIYTHEKLSSSFKGKGLPTGRIAFGFNPQRSFTNEVQAIVEDNKSMTGQAGFAEAKGRFTWLLAEGQKEIKGPFVYRNRLALGLGAAMTGKPRTNVIAQRVYHWINWANYVQVRGAAFYPTDALIDKMVANHATMLILHQHWMEEGGLNGNPHANYIPSDEDAFVHMIEYAHRKGLHVGVYCRGIERYAPSVGFFEKYLKRDWDGLYVDWSSAYNISRHENFEKPDALLGDAHLSTDGVYTAAREWFLYTKQLRRLVGPKGFLIHHQGFGTAGILANLMADAYLPGESPARPSDVQQPRRRGLPRHVGGRSLHAVDDRRVGLQQPRRRGEDGSVGILSARRFGVSARRDAQATQADAVSR